MQIRTTHKKKLFGEKIFSRQKLGQTIHLQNMVLLIKVKDTAKSVKQKEAK